MLWKCDMYIAMNVSACFVSLYFTCSWNEKQNIFSISYSMLSKFQCLFSIYVWLRNIKVCLSPIHISIRINCGCICGRSLRAKCRDVDKLSNDIYITVHTMVQLYLQYKFIPQDASLQCCTRPSYISVFFLSQIRSIIYWSINTNMD